ncbi:MAG: CDP-glucose 4,6-dehydratase [Bacteroidetes bacterium]|nr:CDP-glucose 4,6-dehydratase [Bacteroidota bacterium]
MESMGMINDVIISAFKDKRILVTGDTGFKGSWLSIWLLSLGADVYGYALPPVNVSDNFLRTKLNEKIKHINGDIRDFNSIKEYTGFVQPDIVFHLAAQPLVLEAYKDPVTTYETNVIGTVNLLEAIRATPSAKAAVIVTTDKVYKNYGLKSGYTESDELGGSDPYSASKACSELVVNSYAEAFFKDRNINIATARAGNVIGGGDWAENRIVPDIFRYIHSNREIIIRNPGYIRPWQFVLEPLLGYLLLAAKLFLEGKFYEGAWNFGPDLSSQCTVLELAELFIKRLGPGKIKILEKHTAYKEEKILMLDNSKAIKFLGWHPSLSIKESIDFTVEGYMQEEEAGDLLEQRMLQIHNYTQAAFSENNLHMNNFIV